MRNSQLVSKILSYIELDSELDHFDKIHETIKKELVFKGTNLWILAFAIIIASVGLNMNSTAVIIGAMLISPLMGPINGMGYSVATYNLPLFMQALKNFSFAVSASLIASTAYFLISPISTAHSELLARTSPTIYDVLIALFGGMAGIVAISSKQKGNIIPGVAIATALMPPLCTAGYGLATLQFNYFFGAFFLFTINSVFIALSSVIISQILKFPIRTIVGETHKKKINRWISFVIILVLIPSIYFGYNLVQKEKFNENAEKYVQHIRVFENNYLLNSEIDAKKNTITLIYAGVSLDDEQKNRIRETALAFSLEDAEIKFSQGLSIGADSDQKDEKQQLLNQINQLSSMVKQKEQFIDSLSKSSMEGKQILDEISILFPEITACSFARTLLFQKSTNTREQFSIVIFSTSKKEVRSQDQKKIFEWLKVKLKTENLKVYYDPHQG